MSDKEPRLPDYLGHILDAIDRITRYTLGWTRRLFWRTRWSRTR